MEVNMSDNIRISDVNGDFIAGKGTFLFQEVLDDIPNAKIVKLEENYRSTQTILNAANEVIKNNSSKIDKNLWTQNGEGEKITYKTLNNEYDEVEYVVEKIDDICRRKEEKY